MNWYLMSVLTSSVVVVVGGYVWICTVHAYVISMCISSCALHFIGGMSESVQCMHMWYPCALHLVHFIWWGVYLISECTSSEKFTVTTYIMSSWTLNNVDCFMLLSLSLLLHILIVVFGLFMCNCTWMMIYE